MSEVKSASFPLSIKSVIDIMIEQINFEMNRIADIHMVLYKVILEEVTPILLKKRKYKKDIRKDIRFAYILYKIMDHIFEYIGMRKPVNLDASTFWDKSKFSSPQRQAIINYLQSIRVELIICINEVKLILKKIFGDDVVAGYKQSPISVDDIIKDHQEEIYDCFDYLRNFQRDEYFYSAVYMVVDDIVHGETRRFG